MITINRPIIFQQCTSQSSSLPLSFLFPFCFLLLNMAAAAAASKLSAMQQLIKSDKTMPVMSDDSILVKKIVEEHAPIGLEYDVKPLFYLVEDIFRRSTLSTEGVSEVSNTTLINLPHELYLKKFNLK